ncbi:MAG: glycosyl hydrolase family 28-related protein [Phycisphaerae bacterium]
MTMIDAKLVGATGDGIHDDTVALQQALDVARTGNYTGVFLSAGRYRITSALFLRGTGVSLVGEGVRSVIVQDFHFHGQSGGGDTLWVMPEFDPHWLYPVAPVTHDSITLPGQVNISPGEALFLCDGRGATGLAEKRLGGVLPARDFHELAPCEYVDVAHTIYADGQTTITLKNPVIGTRDYANVAPAGKNGSDLYLQLRRLRIPASNITVANFAIDFADPKADCSIMVYYTRNASVGDITIVREPRPAPAYGGIAVTGCMDSRIKHITASGRAGVGLNSSRCCVVERCYVHSISMEECCTDNHLRNNFLRPTGGFGIRTNDMPCQRNMIVGNTIIGAAANYGAIILWEGRDNMVAGNSAANGDASIYIGSAPGTLAEGNMAQAVTHYGKDKALITGNSVSSR